MRIDKLTLALNERMSIFLPVSMVLNQGGDPETATFPFIVINVN
jgi:hypothetical protein